MECYTPFYPYWVSGFFLGLFIGFIWGRGRRQRFLGEIARIIYSATHGTKLLAEVLGALKKYPE